MMRATCHCEVRATCFPEGGVLTKMKTQNDQQIEGKMKTKNQRNRRFEPKKKFEMPPKQFRGLYSHKNNHHMPPNQFCGLDSRKNNHHMSPKQFILAICVLKSQRSALKLANSTIMISTFIGS